MAQTSVSTKSAPNRVTGIDPTLIAGAGSQPQHLQKRQPILQAAQKPTHDTWGKAGYGWWHENAVALRS